MGEEEQLLGILLIPVLVTLWDAWLIQQNHRVPEGGAGSRFTLYSFSWGGPLAYTLLPAACLRELAIVWVGFSGSALVPLRPPVKRLVQGALAGW